MSEYIYRNFRVFYNIVATQSPEKIYKADGNATYLLRPSHEIAPVKFHTEYENYEGAEREIKKLLEDYVDFELENYYEMQAEKI